MVQILSQQILISVHWWLSLQEKQSKLPCAEFITAAEMLSQLHWLYQHRPQTHQEKRIFLMQLSTAPVHHDWKRWHPIIIHQTMSDAGYCPMSATQSSACAWQWQCIYFQPCFHSNSQDRVQAAESCSFQMATITTMTSLSKLFTAYVILPQISLLCVAHICTKCYQEKPNVG